MASTNEDVVVLATAPLGGGRRQLLVVRHLPDRGTVELGWWEREEGGGAVAPGPSVLELAAEALEVGAVARLCERLAGAGWDDAAVDGQVVAETPPSADGAQVLAVRSGSGLTLVRRPEGGELVLPSRAALGLLAGLFPAARRKLEALGFGLVQQGDQAFPGTAEGHA
jgi:hypothetical protein